MSIEVKLSCPLGHTCEKAVNGHIERCHWYMAVSGRDPNNGDEYKDEWGCAIVWLPRTSLEIARTNNTQTAEVRELKNYVAQGNDRMLKLAEDHAYLPGK